MADRKAQSITRAQAMGAKPVAVPTTARQSLPAGGQRLTMQVTSTRWAQLLLRMPAKVDRTFELDSLGLQVFDLCDGKHTVEQIIRTFSDQNNLERQEAEQAVTAFLRMLMSRGLVTMVVPR